MRWSNYLSIMGGSGKTGDVIICYEVHVYVASHFVGSSGPFPYSACMLFFFISKCDRMQEVLLIYRSVKRQ